MRARPVVSRRAPPRSSPSPLNYTDPSGFSEQANEDIAIGVGVGYFTGLAVHLLTSGGAAGAAVEGGTSAIAAASDVAAPGAAAAAAAPIAEAAGVGAGIATSIATDVILSGRQPTSTVVNAKPTTRSASAGGTGPTTIGRSSFATMATSPVQEADSRDPGELVPCKKGGNPACGTPAGRAARATDLMKAMDKLVKTFPDQYSPDPGFVGSKIREVPLEHGAAVIQRPDGTVRFGIIKTGGFENVTFDLSRAANEKLVGLVHTHGPDVLAGEPPGPAVSVGDIRQATDLGRNRLFLGSYIATVPSNGGTFTFDVYEPGLKLFTLVP